MKRLIALLTLIALPAAAVTLTIPNKAVTYSAKAGQVADFSYNNTKFDCVSLKVERVYDYNVPKVTMQLGSTVKAASLSGGVQSIPSEGKGVYRAKITPDRDSPIRVGFWVSNKVNGKCPADLKPRGAVQPRVQPAPR